MSVCEFKFAFINYSYFHLPFWVILAKSSNEKFATSQTDEVDSTISPTKQPAPDSQPKYI